MIHLVRSGDSDNTEARAARASSPTLGKGRLAPLPLTIDGLASACPWHFSNQPRFQAATYARAFGDPSDVSRSPTSSGLQRHATREDWPVTGVTLARSKKYRSVHTAETIRSRCNK